jgi:GMP synthase (glutamine-hydrolysing)
MAMGVENKDCAGKILIVLHQAHSTPGRIGRLLVEQGACLDIRRPALGDSLPETMRDYDGAVIFGGPMSANDSDDYIKREIDWIKVPLSEGKPFLGVCLGGQMLAKQLGEKVAPHKDGLAEIGYYPIRPTDHSDECFGGRYPNHVYQWHREGFGLPRGATLLAEGDTFEIQAFRYGCNAVALQFHPEVTYAMMCRWTTRAYERMQSPGAQAPHAHLDGWFQHDRKVAIWLDQFLRDWRAAQPARTRARAGAGMAGLPLAAAPAS